MPTNVLEDFASNVLLGPGYAHVLSMHIHWAVDFDTTTLGGNVVLDCVGATEGDDATASASAPVLLLDTRDLDISAVTVDGAAAAFALESSGSDDALGRCLKITLPKAAAKTVYRVVVSYRTSPSSSALQWLEKDMTSSKQHPFLFSQCQAIHARSMIPCQDLCQIKIPYTASVVHPAHLTALMSAVKVSSGSTDEHGNVPPAFVDDDLAARIAAWSAQDLAAAPRGDWAVSYFTQKVPIPSYLIAIVVGELAAKPLGPRSTVWAEPSVVEKAAWEFADTEKMIDVAVDRCGEYRWGVFDLLVLPPSFPYGGMENPCLTFVTPTLIAGDRSQTAVIAHELCHSWSGNLVTNATWEHFWINEGLTVFTETKIVDALFGREASAVRMEEGWQHVHDDMTRFGLDHRFTCLCPRLQRGEDPDDSFSSVPYEKGAALFWCIESLIGEDAMKAAVRAFFDTFALKQITSDALKAFFVAQHPILSSAIAWERWFHEPGMPCYKPPYDSAAIEEATQLAAKWELIQSPEEGRALAESTNESFTKWPSSKKCVFLNTLTNHKAVSFDAVTTMSAGYGLPNANVEIRCALLSLWLPLWGKAATSPRSNTPIDMAKALVSEQGRMKFTRPTYRAWGAVDPDGAKATFQKLQHSYHPICAKMVSRDLSSL